MTSMSIGASGESADFLYIFREWTARFDLRVAVEDGSLGHKPRPSSVVVPPQTTAAQCGQQPRVAIRPLTPWRCRRRRLRPDDFLLAVSRAKSTSSTSAVTGSKTPAPEVTRGAGQSALRI